jgi:DNA-binding transcriptional ArsR family regulator
MAHDTKLSDKNLEKVLKALANKRRIAIVQYLRAHKDGHVGDIADSIKLSFKATSKHLAILVHADILDRAQVRSWMTYKLSHAMPDTARKIIGLF